MLNKYDVFLSFKNLDIQGKQTRESIIATEIYNYLSNRKLKVFCSTITLEKNGKTLHKKTIDAALDNSKLLVAIGTSKEYLESLWVRYEWDSFFCDMLDKKRPEGRIVTYIDKMNISSLPRSLRQNTVIQHGEGSIENLFRLISNILEHHSKANKTKSIKPISSKGDKVISGNDVYSDKKPFKIKSNTSIKDKVFNLPPLSLLNNLSQKGKIDIKELNKKKLELKERLRVFKISGKMTDYTPGPVITTFEFVPDVSIKDVSNLTEDLALVVKAQYVRIERILGKKAIGIEIPNKKREIIHLRELLETLQYKQSISPLTLALGKTANGDIFISDLKEMPHLLIAGATGSGKSVAIHSIILSILYKSSPKSVKFIMIDPKRIELAIYNSLPHMLTPVVVNPKLAKNALDWAVFEMENRYKRLSMLQVCNIEQYNKKLEMLLQSEDDELEQLPDKEPIPYIVIIIDELADLMMASAREIEDDILRLAQKARAIGIHLILATQRPSIDVITVNIKNSFPSRMALAVPSRYDSRTIIDQTGAEKLLGNGDMLFLSPKTASPIRLHSAYVSKPEIVRVVNHFNM